MQSPEKVLEIKHRNRESFEILSTIDHFNILVYVYSSRFVYALLCVCVYYIIFKDKNGVTLQNRHGVCSY